MSEETVVSKIKWSLFSTGKNFGTFRSVGTPGGFHSTDTGGCGNYCSACLQLREVSDLEIEMILQDFY